MDIQTPKSGPEMTCPKFHQGTPTAAKVPGSPILEPALRANKRETIDWLKFTLEGAGERTHGYAFTDTTFAGCWI